MFFEANDLAFFVNPVPAFRTARRIAAIRASLHLY